MFRYYWLTCLLGLSLVVPSVLAQDVSAPFAPGRLIVRFEAPLPQDGDAPLRADSRYARMAVESGVLGVRPLFGSAPTTGSETTRWARAESRRAAGLDAIYILDVAPDGNMGVLAQRWAQLPGVVFAEPDYAGSGAGAPAPGAPTNDPLFDRQWGLENTGSNAVPLALTAGADIQAVDAWGVFEGSGDVLIAVLDSGLRLTHPDIADRVWTNEAETANGLDDDGNGYIDDLQGWDFANDDADPTDDHGHGTNVASIVGASTDNGLGYAGLDQHARLLIGKILDSNNSGFYSWWSEAIRYAADQGADVINLSVGGSGFSASMQAAVDYAHSLGVFMAVSMMNTNNAVPYYPAAYANTVAVGATNGQDERVAPFCWGGGSNFGSHIDISAPGDWIYGLAFDSDTDYNFAWCGTSQATPYVTGAAALLRGFNPTLSPEAIRDRLTSTAEDQVGRPSEDTPGFDIYHGHGRLNVFEALSGLPSSNEPVLGSTPSFLTVFPNPARSSSTLELQLASARTVSAYLFDTLGRRVMTIHDGPLAAGTHRLRLERNGLPGGIYHLRVMADGQSTSRTLTLID